MSTKDAANSTPNHLPLIRASELVQYSFCHSAWWLGTVKNLPSTNQATLARGKQAHSHHAHKVQTALYWRRTGLFLLSSGILFLIIAVLWRWFS
jgi:hypothetical protein